MKLSKLLIILLFLLGLNGCQSTIKPGVSTITDFVNENIDEQLKSEAVEYASFFDKLTIHTIDITLAEEDLQSIYDAPKDETYYRANIILDDVSVENVGFRTKGNMTLRSVADSDSERYSFKINASKYVDDQKVDGLDEFVLNNMYSDASYLREYLSYEVMSNLGMNVPMASFISVSINGEAAGFYLLVESVDDSFLNRVFGENDGNLYRQDEGSDLKVDSSELYKNSNQKNGDDESKADLHKLAKALSNMKNGIKGNIESVLDVDSALYYIASNFMLSNYDSYSSRMQQNYYLYNHEGIFYVVPWDFNMAFGGFPEQVNRDLNIDSPISGVELSELPLIDKLLSVEEYKTRYYEILKDYIKELANTEIHIKELSDWIRPLVEADSTKFVTMEDFEYSIIYQENEEIKNFDRNINNLNDRPLGQRPDDSTDRLKPEGMPTDRPEGMKDDKFMSTGRSLINVFRETFEAVQQQITK